MAEGALKHDEFAPNYFNGPFMVMEGCVSFGSFFKRTAGPRLNVSVRPEVKVLFTINFMCPYVGKKTWTDKFANFKVMLTTNFSDQM